MTGIRGLDSCKRGESPHPRRNQLGRMIWGVVWLFLFRPSPRTFHAWRSMLLRLFGARIGFRAHIYPRARIWAPWNLQMGDDSCLGDHVDCYCVDKITIGPRSVVSQYSFLCTASHDYRSLALPLTTAPIAIGQDVWIAADVFVGPGVSVGTGSVVGARSTVLRDIGAWAVAAGSPAREIGRRPCLA